MSKFVHFEDGAVTKLFGTVDGLAACINSAITEIKVSLKGTPTAIDNNQAKKQLKAAREALAALDGVAKAQIGFQRRKLFDTSLHRCSHDLSEIMAALEAPYVKLLGTNKHTNLARTYVRKITVAFPAVFGRNAPRNKNLPAQKEGEKIISNKEKLLEFLVEKTGLVVKRDTVIKRLKDR